MWRMDNNDDVASSTRRVAANRRNAQLSTGPRTEEGKSWSRCNAIKHGILASSLLVTQGEGAEVEAEFNEFLDGLKTSLAPVGMLEETLVEQIAVCWWRQKRALRCEAGLVKLAFAGPARLVDDHILDRERDTDSKQATIKDHLSLPLGFDLDRILRYETTIQRQLAYAINQLERLQRTRKGEHVPAPVNVQLSSDQ